VISLLTQSALSPNTYEPIEDNKETKDDFHVGDSDLDVVRTSTVTGLPRLAQQRSVRQYSYAVSYEQRRDIIKAFVTQANDG
jgi:P2-related tail formation protein